MRNQPSLEGLLSWWQQGSAVTAVAGETRLRIRELCRFCNGFGRKGRRGSGTAVCALQEHAAVGTQWCAAQNGSNLIEVVFGVGAEFWG
jgi:hypothetical protein